MERTGPHALQQLAEGWCSSHSAQLREALELLHVPVLRILADGRPASVEELARVVSRPRADVSAALDAIPHAERDRDGSVLGLGLSLLPTPYRIAPAAGAREVFGWCAPDSLLLPAMIPIAARVRSRCPSTGTDVVVDVGSGTVDRVRPAGAVLTIVPEPEPDRIRQAGCDHQRFYASAAAAAEWSELHPGGVVMGVAEAFREIIRLAGQPGGGAGCGDDRRAREDRHER